MRSDFSSVVTERPRAGGRIKTPKGYNRDLQRWDEEDQPNREKIRQKWKHGWCEKRFTDVLGPIYRYLHSKVGQKWDDVFSEICQNLPKDSLNTSHVRDHITGMVEIHVMMIDGQPCQGSGGYGYGQPILGYRNTFYVHPETGLLCRLKEQKSYKHNQKKIGIDVPGQTMQQYHCIEGVWYILTLTTFLEFNDIRNKWLLSASDIGYKKSLTYHDRVLLFGGEYRTESKRQLNSKEIRKAGLK